MSKVESLTAVVWRHAPSKYSGTPLVVLLKIAGLTEAKDGHAHVRVHILAQMCGVTERRAQQIVEDLKADRVLRVQYRKGKSSVFLLNIDLLRGLPLAVKPAEQASNEPQEAEPQLQLTDAQFISELLTQSFIKIDALIPPDWQTTWPVEFQKLLDAGHTLAAIRGIARFALGVECHKVELSRRGPVMLVEKFASLLELSETFGNKKVAA